MISFVVKFFSKFSWGGGVEGYGVNGEMPLNFNVNLTH
jgi:hypothetical protein